MKQDERWPMIALCSILGMALASVLKRSSGRLFMLFCLGILLIVYLLSKFVFFKTFERVKALNKEDFVKSKEYYREILKKYSPAELAYLDFMSYDKKKTIVVSLLSLKLKKYISFNENDREIVVLNNDDTCLENDEWRILKGIKSGKINKDINLNKDIKEKLIQKGLIIKKTSSSDLSISFLGFFSFFFVGIVIPYLILALYYDYELTFGAIVIGIIITLGFIISLVSTIALIKNYYVRTPSGEEINSKLEGLKAFLSDFSKLDERETEEIILWEDYLMYSVIFGQNKKIIDEILKNYCI